MSVTDYLNLIPAANRLKPKFVATVQVNVEIFSRVNDLLVSMMGSLFDPDTAVGDQLDIIGQWVGISRNVKIPISGVYFSWNGSALVGWSYGVWQPSALPNTITILPDDSYRVLVKAKIAANKWDGTTEGAYKVWDAVFPNITILIQDHQNMTYSLIIVGGIVDSLTQALITGGYIPLRPEGVRINSFFFPVDTNPVFGWGVNSAFIQGWGTGSWAREISPT